MPTVRLHTSISVDIDEGPQETNKVMRCLFFYSDFEKLSNSSQDYPQIPNTKAFTQNILIVY